MSSHQPPPLPPPTQIQYFLFFLFLSPFFPFPSPFVSNFPHNFFPLSFFFSFPFFSSHSLLPSFEIFLLTFYHFPFYSSHLFSFLPFFQSYSHIYLISSSFFQYFSFNSMCSFSPIIYFFLYVFSLEMYKIAPRFTGLFLFQ